MPVIRVARVVYEPVEIGPLQGVTFVPVHQRKAQGLPCKCSVCEQEIDSPIMVMSRVDGHGALMFHLSCVIDDPAVAETLTRVLAEKAPLVDEPAGR